jgi:hypothetical protein
LMQNNDEFKLIAQSFFLFAIVLYLLICFCLKKKKIEITYDIVFKLVFFIMFPIISFPFLILSNLSIRHKIFAAVAALSTALIQFFVTKLFRERAKKDQPKVI